MVKGLADAKGKECIKYWPVIVVVTKIDPLPNYPRTTNAIM